MISMRSLRPHRRCNGRNILVKQPCHGVNPWKFDFSILSQQAYSSGDGPPATSNILIDRGVVVLRLTELISNSVMGWVIGTYMAELESTVLHGWPARP
jgi:hypothetical protein